MIAFNVWAKKETRAEGEFTIIKADFTIVVYTTLLNETKKNEIKSLLLLKNNLQYKLKTTD